MSHSTSNSTDNSWSTDLSGQELGDYHILRRLGRGAMAEVYLAQQSSLKRQVAFKVLRRELATDSSYVQRFHNEASSAANLTHANIVQIYEVGEIEGIHFIAQEYVAGRNLGEVLKRSGPPDIKLIVAIVRQVASALYKAEDRGIVHRDIKPDNIMLARTGEVKVADFGLARTVENDGTDLTQVGITMGTPLYMSPEQVEGKPLDSRSDLYSLGVTCYHMLCGAPPFSGETAISVAVQHINSAPERLETRRPDLPEGLCRIVHKMMEKRPEDRYQTPRELLLELRNLKIEGLEEGWTDGVEEWSTAEMIALSDSGIAATQQLGSLMETAAQLTATPRKRKLPKLALAVLGCLLLGAVTAYFFRPQFLLAGAEDPTIPKRKNVWAQLLHAKMAGSEEAWESVEDYFPASKYENRYAVNLAKQGLVRHYLLQTGEYQKALPILDQLASLSETEVSLRAFGVAGKCVVKSLLGEQDEALLLWGQMTPEMIDRLDPAMRNLLLQQLSTIHKSMSADAAKKMQQLREAADEGDG